MSSSSYVDQYLSTYRFVLDVDWLEICNHWLHLVFQCLSTQKPQLLLKKRWSIYRLQSVQIQHLSTYRSVSHRFGQTAVLSSCHENTLFSLQSMPIDISILTNVWSVFVDILIDSFEGDSSCYFHALDLCYFSFLPNTQWAVNNIDMLGRFWSTF